MWTQQLFLSPGLLPYNLTPDGSIRADGISGVRTYVRLMLLFSQCYVWSHNRIANALLAKATLFAVWLWKLLNISSVHLHLPFFRNVRSECFDTGCCVAWLDSTWFCLTSETSFYFEQWALRLMFGPIICPGWNVNASHCIWKDIFIKTTIT